jgi:ankyrin repeat protein
MKRLLNLKPVLIAVCVAMSLPTAWAQAQPAPEVIAGMNESPIHDAARMGQRQDVESLLKASPQNRDARTPLGATPLHYAAMNADSGPLKALLAAGASPNARDGDGRTALHMAAFSTRKDNTMLLLQAGSDPLLKTNDGRDVLSMARKVRADEIAGEISLWILKGCKPGKPVKSC